MLRVAHWYWVISASDMFQNYSAIIGSYWNYLKIINAYFNANFIAVKVDSTLYIWAVLDTVTEQNSKRLIMQMYVDWRYYFNYY